MKQTKELTIIVNGQKVQTTGELVNYKEDYKDAWVSHLVSPTDETYGYVVACGDYETLCDVLNSEYPEELKAQYLVVKGGREVKEDIPTISMD